MLMLVVFRSKFPGRQFKSHPGVPPARLLDPFILKTMVVENRNSQSEKDYPARILERGSEMRVEFMWERGDFQELIANAVTIGCRFAIFVK